MAAPTMMTLATPMMTPSSVRKLRSLWARRESAASRKAFWNCCQERDSPEPDWTMFFQDNVIWRFATDMHNLRLAYATQYLIALIAVFVLWSQVGGQSHLDLMPWFVKLAMGAGTALAV